MDELEKQRLELGKRLVEFKPDTRPIAPKVPLRFDYSTKATATPEMSDEDLANERIARRVELMRQELLKDDRYSILAETPQPGETYAGVIGRRIIPGARFALESALKKESIVSEELTAWQEVKRQARRTRNTLLTLWDWGIPTTLNSAMGLSWGAVEAAADVPAAALNKAFDTDIDPNFRFAPEKSKVWEYLLGRDVERDYLGRAISVKPREIRSTQEFAKDITAGIMDMAPETTASSPKEAAIFGSAGAIGIQVLDTALSYAGIKSAAKAALVDVAIRQGTTRISSAILKQLEKDGVDITEAVTKEVNKLAREMVKAKNGDEALSKLSDIAKKYAPDGGLARTTDEQLAARTSDVMEANAILRETASASGTADDFITSVRNQLQAERVLLRNAVAAKTADLAVSDNVREITKRFDELFAEFGDKTTGNLRPDTPTALADEFEDLGRQISEVRDNIIEPRMRQLAMLSDQVPLGTGAFDLTQPLLATSGKDLDTVLREIFAEAQKGRTSALQILESPLEKTVKATDQEVVDTVRQLQREMVQLQNMRDATRLPGAAALNRGMIQEAISRGISPRRLGLEDTIGITRQFDEFRLTDDMKFSKPPKLENDVLPDSEVSATIINRLSTPEAKAFAKFTKGEKEEIAQWLQKIVLKNLFEGQEGVITKAKNVPIKLGDGVRGRYSIRLRLPKEGAPRGQIDLVDGVSGESFPLIPSREVGRKLAQYRKEFADDAAAKVAEFEQRVGQIPGHAEFAAVGNGHARFSENLQKLVDMGSILPEDAALLRGIFAGTDDATLAGLDIKLLDSSKDAMARDMNVLGRTTANGIEMRRGLAYMDVYKDMRPARRNVQERSLLGSEVFLHEYGHYGHAMLLNEGEQDIVFNAWKNAMDTGKGVTFFRKAGMTDTEIEHAMKNEREFFSAAFAQYVLKNRAPDGALLPFYKRFINAIKRFLEPLMKRDEFPTLEPLFKQIQKGEKSFGNSPLRDALSTRKGIPSALVNLGDGKVALPILPSVMARALNQETEEGFKRVVMNYIGQTYTPGQIERVLSTHGYDADKYAEALLLEVGPLREWVKQLAENSKGAKDYTVSEGGKSQNFNDMVDVNLFVSRRLNSGGKNVSVTVNKMDGSKTIIDVTRGTVSTEGLPVKPRERIKKREDLTNTARQPIGKSRERIPRAKDNVEIDKKLRASSITGQKEADIIGKAPKAAKSDTTITKAQAVRAKRLAAITDTSGQPAMRAMFLKDSLKRNMLDTDVANATADEIENMLSGIAVPATLRKGSQQLAGFVRRMNRQLVAKEKARLSQRQQHIEARENLEKAFKAKAATIESRKQAILDTAKDLSRERFRVGVSNGRGFIWKQKAVTYTAGEWKMIANKVNKAKTEKQLILAKEYLNKITDKALRREAIATLKEVRTNLDKIPASWQWELHKAMLNDPDPIKAAEGMGVSFVKFTPDTIERLKKLADYLEKSPDTIRKFESRKSLKDLANIREMKKKNVKDMTTDELLTMAYRAEQIFDEGRTAYKIKHGHTTKGNRQDIAIVDDQGDPIVIGGQPIVDADGNITEIGEQYVMQKITVQGKHFKTEKIPGLEELQYEAAAREIAQGGGYKLDSTKNAVEKFGLKEEDGKLKTMTQVMDMLHKQYEVGQKAFMNELLVNWLTTDRVFSLLDNMDYHGMNSINIKERLMDKVNLGEGNGKAYTDRFDAKILEIVNKYGKEAESLKDTRADNHTWTRIAVHAYAKQEGGTMKLIESMGDDYAGKQAMKALIEKVGYSDDGLKPFEKEIYDFMRKELDDLYPSVFNTMLDTHDTILGWVKDYFPIQNNLIDNRGMVEIMQKEFDVKMRQTKRGFTFERLTMAGGNQMYLNARNIYLKHVKDATYFAAVDPEIKRISGITRTKQYRESVGGVGADYVKDWIDIIARRGLHPQVIFNRYDLIKKYIGGGVLGFNPSPVIKQVLSVFPSMALIGVPAHAKALAFISSRIMAGEGVGKLGGALSVHRAIRKNSKFMELRTYDDPAFTDLKVGGKLERWQETGYLGIRTGDSIMADWTWLASYMRETERNGNKFDFARFADGIFDDDARRKADLHVRLTQGSGRFMDAPMILTGKNKRVWGSIFQFQSFVMGQSQVITHDVITKAIMTGKSGKDSAKLLKEMAKGSVVASTVLGGIYLEDMMTLWLTSLYGSESYEQQMRERTNWRVAADVMGTAIPPLGIIMNLTNTDNTRTNVPVLDTTIGTFKAVGGALTKDDLEAQMKDSTRAVQGIATMFGGSGAGFAGTVARGQLGLDWMFETPAEAVADSIKRKDKNDAKLLLQKYEAEGLDIEEIKSKALEKVRTDKLRENKAIIDKVVRVLESNKSGADKKAFIQELIDDGVLDQDMLKEVKTQMNSRARRKKIGEGFKN